MDSAERLLAIGHFLESPGYKLFCEELESLKTDIKIKMDNLEVSPQESVAAYNFNIGMKKGYQNIQYVLDGFKDELAEER